MKPSSSLVRACAANEILIKQEGRKEPHQSTKYENKEASIIQSLASFEQVVEWQKGKYDSNPTVSN